MTITEKFTLMQNSFADIAAAIVEMGGTAGGGYNAYANGVRGIYGGRAAAVTDYPKNADIIGKLQFCRTVKEEIRQAIIEGGVECDSSVPLSAYGGKIREIKTAEPLEIVTSSLPDGTRLSEYSAQFEASGGKPPYTWARAGGVMPPGLTVNSDGSVTGTPTSYGYYPSFKVRCTDGSGTMKSKKITIFITQRHVYIEPVDDGVFEYDGLPHTREFICVTDPSVTITAYTLDDSASVGTHYLYFSASDGSFVDAKGYYLTIKPKE